MTVRRIRQWLVAVGVLLVGVVSGIEVAFGQLGERAFGGSLDHPAIAYTTRPVNDPVSKLNQQIAQGRAQLSFNPSSPYPRSLDPIAGGSALGYLESVLDALEVPRESQILVFSKNGIQRRHTSPSSPRAFFFNDSVVVGYIRGAPFLELAAHDPRQAVVFYTLDQLPGAAFERRDICLSCHVSFNSLDVPGMLVRSTVTAADGAPMPWLGNNLIDHRSSFEQRWGGWYVTGAPGSIRHLGNATVTSANNVESMVSQATLNLPSLESRFDTSGYLSAQSDIAALMVFEHQMRMVNLLTRIGWEARLALAEHRLDMDKGPLQEAVNEVVEYPLLFVDEAPLSAKIAGTSSFAKKFSAQGPRDSKRRSLRELDLVTRLLRYPCSYMIYTEAFDNLPAEAKDAIYRRMWQILSGQEKDSRYARLSIGDRRAVVEILRETKQGLPTYFQ